MRLYFVGICLLFLGGGCGPGSDPEDKRSIRLVDGPPPREKSAPPDFRFRFEKPKADERTFDPDASIPVEFILEVPDGAKRPSVAVLHLMDGKVIVNSSLANRMDGTTDGNLRFGGTIKARSVPGKYFLRAEVSQTTIYKVKPKDSVPVTVNVDSTPIDIVIRKPK